MAEVIITPLGTVSPYPKNNMNCPGFLIENNDYRVLLDCGEGVTIKGRTTMEDNDQEVPFYLVVTPGTYNVLDLSIKYKNIDAPVKMRIAHQDAPLTIGRNEIWTIKYTCVNDKFTGEITGFESTEKDVNNE